MSSLSDYWQWRARTSVDNLHYRDVKLAKLPEDLALYHEVIWDTKPDTIIELGTAKGGSAMWFADQMSLYHEFPVVITVDTNGVKPEHRYVAAVKGDVRSDETLQKVKKLIGDRVMVVEDSAHTYDVTLTAMRKYGPLVTSGCYMVIEDTIVEDKENCPPDWYRADSVVAAIDDFMNERGSGWEREDKRKFLVTMHDRGWLRKL